jgi:hypothetical protein
MHRIHEVSLKVRLLSLNYIFTQGRSKEGARSAYASGAILEGRRIEKFAFYLKKYTGQCCVFYLQKLQRSLCFSIKKLFYKII